MKSFPIIILVLSFYFLACGPTKSEHSIIQESSSKTVAGSVTAGSTSCPAIYVAPSTVLASLSCLSEGRESEVTYSGDSLSLSVVDVIGIDKSEDLVAFESRKTQNLRWGIKIPKIKLPDLPNIPDGGLSDALKDVAKSLDPSRLFNDLVSSIANKIVPDVAAQAKSGGWTTLNCAAVGSGAILLPAATYIAPACAASAFITAGMGTPACVTAVSSSIVAATCVSLCETKNLSDCRGE